MKLTKKDMELIELATQVAIENKDLYDTRKSVVASIILGKSGRAYKGLNIKTSHSICAEQVALGYALSCGEREFETIVAVKMSADGEVLVTSPCGLCRYTLEKLNLNINVILRDVETNAIHKVKVKDLLPYAFDEGDLNE